MKFVLATAVATVVAAVSIPTRAADPAPPTRPNVILLLADDLGWTDLHTGAPSAGHGSKYHQTPHLDRLAAEGCSLTSAYANPNCAPTRASIMTGQSSPRNGVYNVGSLDRGKGRLTPPAQIEHIRPEAVTLAENLKSAGYATAHVAKYHVGKPAEILASHGFDANYGGGHKGDGGPKSYFAVRDGDGWTFANLGPEMNPFAAPYTQDYIDKNLEPVATGNDTSPLAGTPKHLTDATADAALDFMTKHAAGPDKSKPFFINVAFNAVHAGIHPRPDLLAKFKALKSNDPRHPRPEYAALLEGMDQSIGRILRHLDDPNADGDTSDSIAKNTLVLFTSDNGGFANATNNAPLRGFKGMFYDGGIRVPVIARLPGTVPAGQTSDALVSVVDLYPTFAEFAGAKLPDPKSHTLDGRSYASALKEPIATRAARPPVFFHFPGYLDSRAYPCSVVIKDHGPTGHRHKLIYSYEDQHYELYDLTADISETTNLLDGQVTAANTEIAADLRRDLTHWLPAVGASFPQDPKTGKAVPLPIPVEDALKSGNRSTRQVAPKSGSD